ncbi:MAG: UvrD-helicase domain-containing protein [Aquabacterium sp.]|jgi:ATP-dependent helicase/nuclease subunit A
MSHAAYWINGQPAEPATFYEWACDPGRSVVVEACAGAGKTWMLVSRILRALLDGVPPEQILAITFTRKAAGEMRERLREWLEELSTASAEHQVEQLLLRGVSPEDVPRMREALGALQTQWLSGGQGVGLYTIHSWFAQLVKAAPLEVLAELGLPPELALLEDVDELWDELWARLLKRIDQYAHSKDVGESAYATSFDMMLREVGAHNLAEWLRASLNQRTEISLAAGAGVLIHSVPSAQRWHEDWAAWERPEQALADPALLQRFKALASSLGGLTDRVKAQSAAQGLVQALEEQDLSRRATLLCKSLLTDDGTPRKQLIKTPDQAPELAWAQEWLVSLGQALQQQAAHEHHVHMVLLSQLLFTEYARLKQERGLCDMSDLEMAASRLLSDPVLSGWVQERLDTRIRLLLMDEFQDTSPLQWQALRTWLSAYAGAGGGRSGQAPLTVFLVGDPKQSIYRFRRADPRVFAAARSFVIETLGGALLACDHTRRNATAVIEALNQVMLPAAQEGLMTGYRAHTTEATETGQVRVLAMAQASESSADAGEEAAPIGHDGWRDSLTEPRVLRLAGARELEAEQVAKAVVSLLRGAPEGGGAPAIEAKDIFVLARKRAPLLEVARALERHGIAHQAPSDTLLAEVPEVRDVLALMDVLVSPQHDLSLAQALKSAFFEASDEDLMVLAEQARLGRTSWWQALMSPEASTSVDIRPALKAARTCLTQWAALAQVLPPHDLLSRVVHDADLRARLVARVPRSRRAQAVMHVEALLQAALAMDAGRDATPYRFIRALRRSTVKVPARAASDAVQLLTIHGAKGLEAKVVFLVDTQPTRTQSDTYALAVDWPQHLSHPACVAFVRSATRPPPSLIDLMNTEQHEQLREHFNALYVAMTRAKEQLIISRAPWGRSADASPHTWWQRMVHSGAIQPDVVWEPDVSVTEAHGGTGKAVQAETLVWSDLPDVPRRPALRATMADEGDEGHLKALGETVHRALEWLTTLPVSARREAVVSQAVQQAAQACGLPQALRAQARAQVGRVLHAPALQPWLDPSQCLWAGNEVALYHQGELLRLDRLVAKAQDGARQWWVIDYKLGHRPQAQETYRQQLRRYVAAVSALQPGELVRAAFITGQGEWVPWED